MFRIKAKSESWGNVKLEWNLLLQDWKFWEGIQRRRGGFGQKDTRWLWRLTVRKSFRNITSQYWDLRILFTWAVGLLYKYTNGHNTGPFYNLVLLCFEASPYCLSDIPEGHQTQCWKGCLKGVPLLIRTSLCNILDFKVSIQFMLTVIWNYMKFKN